MVRSNTPNGNIIQGFTVYEFMARSVGAGARWIQGKAARGDREVRVPLLARNIRRVPNTASRLANPTLLQKYYAIKLPREQRPGIGERRGSALRWHHVGERGVNGSCGLT